MPGSERPLGGRLKRSFDLLCLALLLPPVGLLGLVVAVVIRLVDGSPVLFQQARHGFAGGSFTLYKFRTMRASAVETTGDESSRISRLGATLRKLSLDEIPQLINIARGDMSFVGPRPLLPRYTPYFSSVERQRFLARPGVTGLAQVSGRNSLSWDERLTLDVEYVTTWSLVRDIVILVRTVLIAIRREGVAVAPGAVMQDLDQERR